MAERGARARGKAKAGTEASPSAQALLATYEKKRRFDDTPEPSGRAGKTKPSKTQRQRFVIQMHRASRLHWDFRLEADGVLKSWAVPKGPTLDTAEKRFAAHVEDHPLDYREFEGTIPKGNYGAGEVVVWDEGTYELLEGTDTTAQLEKGSLKFELFGHKLHGGFALVKIRGRDGEENSWLLIKERDEFVDATWRIEDHPESVLSGKTVAELAKDPSAPHWISNRSEVPATPATATKARVAAAARSKKTPGAKKPAERLPEVSAPMLAASAEHPFDDDKWLFELKWDGYRALARIDGEGKVTLSSRSGLDLLPRYPELRDLGSAFSERPLLVDGEIVVLDAGGRPSFGGLQERSEKFSAKLMHELPVTYVAFDILYAGGRDVRGEPLEKRKALLEERMLPSPLTMYSKHIVGEGKQLFELAKAQSLEGIIAKKRDSKYQERRTRDWLKLKTTLRQEFVVGGWLETDKSRPFKSLLVGAYSGTRLVFAGAVGGGFDNKRLVQMGAALRELSRSQSPFESLPKLGARAHFVEPKIVVEVEFAEWTRAGLLRQPRFLGTRDDKAPGDVVREAPAGDDG